ncbi:hypothetical protein M3Y97_00923300 [Aphelenchoides bicaudatus]|nr:hypothetical protein M3Y97_00923300 [Aphelenchoides bicaudatus]
MHNLPFLIDQINLGYEVTPCDLISCEDYCVLGEGFPEAVATCVCPDCLSDSQYEAKKEGDFCETSTQFPLILLLILLVSTTTALIVEVKFDWVSKFV